MHQDIDWIVRAASPPRDQKDPEAEAAVRGRLLAMGPLQLASLKGRIEAGESTVIFPAIQAQLRG